MNFLFMFSQVSNSLCSFSDRNPSPEAPFGQIMEESGNVEWIDGMFFEELFQKIY